MFIAFVCQCYSKKLVKSDVKRSLSHKTNFKEDDEWNIDGTYVSSPIILEKVALGTGKWWSQSK